jgi:2-polyprenyl-3-methyl-5-hydroxy-6-metoxy-1,4-benzoquinol methylase
MHQVTSCPACDSTLWKSVFDVTDHSISHETFKLIKCDGCGLIATSPRPNDDKLGKYYESEKYISHSGTSSGIVNSIYLQARKYALNWKHQIINKLSSKKSILDFGCGTGEFLQHMQQKGWAVSGMEPSENARNKAEKLIGQSIATSQDNLNSQHDVITLWHVLEHIPDPNKTIAKLKSVLTDNGNILIAVPNHSSFDGQHYGPLWAGYDVPRHLWHFNQKAMVQLLQKHGFTVKQIIPMKLDAYYVSMLSEKYKNSGGLMSLIKGAWYGFHSNLGGRKTGEYSSLIYIAKK